MHRTCHTSLVCCVSHANFLLCVCCGQVRSAVAHTAAAAGAGLMELNLELSDLQVRHTSVHGTDRTLCPSGYSYLLLLPLRTLIAGTVATHRFTFQVDFCPTLLLCW
jgi:hypothetical protein